MNEYANERCTGDKTVSHLPGNVIGTSERGRRCISEKQYFPRTVLENYIIFKSVNNHHEKTNSKKPPCTKARRSL